jgi:two-component system chemotaxis sensor kinase CheA
VTIRLPVSSALMDGFAVGLDEDVFLLPREAVQEVLGLPAGDRELAAGVLQRRGGPLPFVRLHDLLACQRPPPAQENLVVLDFDGQQLGLVVEQLHGETRAVIKPMSAAFRSVRVFSGCAVLGSGRIGLVLDIAGLFQEALRFRAARPMTAAAAGGRA